MILEKKSIWGQLFAGAKGMRLQQVILTTYTLNTGILPDVLLETIALERGVLLKNIGIEEKLLLLARYGKDTVEKKTIDVSKIKVGAKVAHPKFGDGVITEVTPNSSNHCVKIKFEVVGEKMLSLEYAPIEFKD